MLDLFIDGIVLGSILALGAMGLSFQYGVLNFPNLAHGEFMAIGAYCALITNKWLGWGIVESCVFSIIGAICLGLLLEKALWRPLRRAGAGLVTFLIVSMGASIALRNSVIAGFGGTFHYYTVPPKPPFAFLGVTIGRYHLMVIISSVIVMFAIYYILERTTFGKSLRAISDNIDLAKISGINVDKVVTRMWIIVMLLSGLAGVLYGLAIMVRPAMGFYLLLPIFSAVIMGGVGNVYGAMLGAMILGISEEMSTAFLPMEYKTAVAFIALIIVLVFRPKGIFRGLR